MAHDTARRGRRRGILSNGPRLTALVLGAALALLGVAGLLTPGEELLVFGVTPLHDALHLVTGLFGLAVGLVGASYAAAYDQTMAVVYGALVLAWLTSPEPVAALLNAGVADAWLHGALALAFGLVGFFAPLARSRGS